MGVSSAWRGDALNDLLSKPAFAPVQAKKRAPRPSKYSEESEAASDAAAKSMSPRMGKLGHSKKASSSVGEPAPWDPKKSPFLRDLGYTMTTDDLQPGMTVTQWNTESPHTIGAVNHLTQDGTHLTYTDGTEAMTGRGASFALGIPPQNRV
jgi:hypothetical protein